VTELDCLRSAFKSTFGTEGRPFGASSNRWVGVSDDAKGVQWNAALDRELGVATLGVNLEGMEYQGWPIAGFIERELAQPALMMMAGGFTDVDLSLSRDAWQAAARLPIKERQIGGAVIRLATLTPTQWRDMLREAYQCLNPERNHRGRARQWVTLKSGRVEKWVSPHLHLGRAIWRTTPSPTEAARAMRGARDSMQPLYDFVRRRSA
jgi:hypothetical protein